MHVQEIVYFIAVLSKWLIFRIPLWNGNLLLHVYMIWAGFKTDRSTEQLIAKYEGEIC